MAAETVLNESTALPQNLLNDYIPNGIIKFDAETEQFKNFEYFKQKAPRSIAEIYAQFYEEDRFDYFYIWADNTSLAEEDDPYRAIVLFTFDQEHADYYDANILVSLGKFDSPKTVVEMLNDSQVLPPVDTPVLFPVYNEPINIVEAVNKRREVYRWFESDNGWRTDQMTLLDILTVSLDVPETLGIPAKHTSLAKETDDTFSCVSFMLSKDGTFNLYHKYDNPTEMFNDEFATDWNWFKKRDKILISPKW